MASKIKKAVLQICEEKGLSEDDVVSTIEAALAAAFRKDFAEKDQNIKVVFNLDTAESEVFDVKEVVEDLPEGAEETDEVERPAEPELDENGEEVKRFNPKTDIQISDAQKIDKHSKVGEELKQRLPIPDAYGRMAAQTAKQVIIQKLREAERETQYNDFIEKEHTVMMGTVQRRDGWNVLVDIDRSTARMPKEEQIDREGYRTGDRIKVYIKSVEQTNRGPEIIVSRVSEEIVRSVFENEIPEIANGVIEIKAIAREAGARSKVAVYTNDENIDPIGSCVGQRGTRVQTIISELGGEKIDIIEYEENPEKYITNALAPAELTSIELDEEEKKAVVTVGDEQLSLAIGRSGQNVRLASKLTGWKIDIKSESGEVVDPDKVDNDSETKERAEEKEAAEDVDSSVDSEKPQQGDDETEEETDNNDDKSESVDVPQKKEEPKEEGKEDQPKDGEPQDQKSEG